MKRIIFLAGILWVVFAASSSYCLAASPMKNDKAEESYQFSGRVENGVRIIEVKASRYKFEPDPIVVRLGEKVRLVVTSTDVTHGLAISEFRVNLSVPVGKTKDVVFVADKKGTFHAHCSVYCGEGHAKMHATFIVK